LFPSGSQIKKVYVVGRRGSAQAAFTMKEVREITKLEGAACVVDPKNMAAGLTDASKQEIGEQRTKKRMHELLGKVAESYGTNSNAERQIELRFLASPVAFSEDPSRPGAVGSVRVEKTRLEGDANSQRAVGTGEMEDIPCGLALRSIGYKSTPIDRAVPFDTKRHVVPNEHGRVMSSEGAQATGLYCSGWLKRGPSGIIGSNIIDARETVTCILEDAAKQSLLQPIEDSEGLQAIRRLVAARHPHAQFVDWQDVQRLHAEEEQRGQRVGKPREKFTNVDEMLAVVAKQ
jgi:adrenodoxin-NADP+ reductase